MPRTTALRPFQSILCPVDFSSNSRAALRYAAMLADLSNARLVVIHVEDPLLATTAAIRYDAATIIASNEVELRRFVSAVVSRSRPAVGVTLLSIAGRPAKEITKAAVRHRCDLIVMGYRGVGRASRLLFGSTTEGVVRLSPIPVLAIPPARRHARLPARSALKRAS